MNLKPALASRADLLRAMQMYADMPLAEIAALLSYLPEPFSSERNANEENQQLYVADGGDSSQNATNTNKRQPTQEILSEAFYYLSSRINSVVDDPDEGDQANHHIPAPIRGIDEFHPKELAIPQDVPAPPELLPLVSQARLLPFLRRILSQPGAQQLDMQELVRKVSQLQPLYRIPLRQRQIPAGRVCILLDLNRRLLPFWEDFHRLSALVVRKHGQLGLDVRCLDDGPGGTFTDWFDSDKAAQPWIMPEPNTVILVLSDLGLLTATGNPLRRQWLHFGKAMRHHGLLPVVLTPVALQRQDKELQRIYCRIIWDKNSRFVQQTNVMPNPQRAEWVERLLALTSPALHVEPGLLRAIGYLLPAEQADSGLEAEAWLHADVQWGFTAFSLQPSKRDYYQQQFSQQDPILQKNVLCLIKKYHANQFPGVWAEEVLQAATLVNFDLDEIADVEQQQLFMRRFTRSYFAQPQQIGMRQYSQRHLARVSSDFKQQQPYTTLLYSLSNRTELRNGAIVPAEYDTSMVQTVIQQRMEPRDYLVMQQGERFMLSPSSPILHRGLQTASPVAEIRVSNDMLRLTTNGQTQNARVQVGHPLCKLPQAPAIVELDTGDEGLIFSAMIKPSWAQAIGRDQQGLFANFQWLGNQQRLYWQNPTLTQPGQWVGDQTSGVDQYGLYIDLSIKQCIQRFRWIEPGTFLMGSPETEPGCYDDEAQHQVTISQGYWLADTACTQALWQVVMGNNPSRFKNDANNSVEQVSWNNVQQFIELLNKMIPGLNAGLPSEAQWEYACRAGTTTPFSFGKNITPAQVNYDGELPYADGNKGLNRKKTVPVKSLPANPWGLYEMHGNVWEWCQDWFGDYSAESVEDPLGPVKGTARVFAWRFLAQLRQGRAFCLPPQVPA